MSRFFSGFFGALVEAWQELRIHRTRVLLSLVGVAVAVCAITTVVGAGAITEQVTVESSERWGGRPATLQLNANMADGSAPKAEVMQAAWQGALERYDISYASRVTGGAQNVQFVDGVAAVQVQAVDQPYGAIHRMKLSGGSWFAKTDAERLAPALVVNRIVWERLGSPALETYPTLKLIGAQQDATGVIVGVYPTNGEWDTEPAMFMLTEAFAMLSDPAMSDMAYSQYEAWVPPELADELTMRLQSDISAALGEGAMADVYRNDYGAQEGDPYLALKLMIGGIAALVLLLGALSLVNISLVTLRQRIREIGIRRSFGATAGRVFFAVMMESVVATVAAGAVGVMGAILIIKSPWVEEMLGQGMISDFPPFPVDAAIIGLVAATAVGALAGLLPALVAVRVKVIDAIRF